MVRTFDLGNLFIQCASVTKHWFGISQMAVMPYSWEGNSGFGLVLAMHHRTLFDLGILL